VSPHAVRDSGALARTFAAVGAEIKVPTLSVGVGGTWRSGNAVASMVVI
jgi:hypothetical protein